MRSQNFGHGAMEHFMRPEVPGQGSFEGMPAAPPVERTQMSLDDSPTAAAGRERMQRKQQNRGRWESMRTRIEDDSLEDDEDGEYADSQMGKTVGPINVNDLGMEWEPSWGGGGIPDSLSFHGAAQSSWRKFATKEEVPIVGIKTPQTTVSARRMEEARTDPTTRSSPRFPPGMEEFPKVYRDPSGGHHVVDGNHRISSAIANGQMLHPAHVLTDADIPNVKAHTKKIRGLKTAAEWNPNRNPDAEELEQRLYMGDNY